MSTEAVWFYAAGTDRKGPHARGHFRSLLESGTITGETLVWTSGMPAWLPLSRSELASELDGVPPPIPLAAAPQIPPIPVVAPPEVVTDASTSPFMRALRTCFSKYAVFTGRAKRPEFWFFYIFVVCGCFAIALIEGVLFGYEEPIFAYLFLLATALPSLSVNVRRLHDTDRSGWWVLLNVVPLGAIALIILCAQPGTPGPNRFG